MGELGRPMLSEKQWKVFCFGETSYDAIICDGAVRSGKTSIISTAFIEWAMGHFSNRNFIIAGASVGSCCRNVINPLLATRFITGRYAVTWSGSAHCLTVSDGAKTNVFYVFGGKDAASYRVVQGLTAAGCFLDEVVLMPRSFVEQCMARCSVEGSKFWFSCNPGSSSHWFYREWVQDAKAKNAYRIHFKLTDNPSLSAKTIERYERMYTGVFKQRYIDGEWVAAEGIIYPMWRDAMEATWKPSKENPAVSWCLSIDYGTLNPFAAILWAQDRAGKWHAVAEYYYNGRKEMHQKTDADYVNDMVRFCNGYSDEPIETIVDPSAASFITALRRNGGFRVRKANNNVLDGIRDVSVALQTQLIGIGESLEAVQYEFEMYIWDEKKDDQPLKENDHAMDALRYFVYTKRIAKARESDYVSPFEKKAERNLRNGLHF